MIARALSCLYLCLITNVAIALNARDDEGRELMLAQEAQRIVSIAPHITELLFNIGAGTRVVGTVNRSDYPPPARAVPRVGDNGRLDMERIVSLKPDVVVAWGGGNPPKDLERLRQLGLSVFVISPHRLDDVARHLELMGDITGMKAQAQRAAADYRRQLATLRTGYAGRTPVTVFYQVWQTPLMTIGGEQIISEAIALCGGQNIFAELPTLAPTVSIEAVLAKDPEMIITASEQPAAQVLANWRSWPQLRAVRHRQLATISGDYMARATPIILRGVQRLCDIIDKARAVNPK